MDGKSIVNRTYGHLLNIIYYLNKFAMKTLVLVEDYPNNNGGVKLMYVHTRNLYYQKNGIDVTVLNFNSKNEYSYENIRVISFEQYKKANTKYDLLILHAANIKHHYRFLLSYGKNFDYFLFFYHGHEVLKINCVYSAPYPYVHSNFAKTKLRDIYDDYKLTIWRRYIPTIYKKSYFVFVSKWMENQFYKWTKLDTRYLRDRSFITYNNVGLEFEEGVYNPDEHKKYDFITIRGNIDGSKYCIDVVNNLAINTPNGKFLLIGKGNYFDHYDKADNLTWINSVLSHSEIIEKLQEARFALMPTRTDAQGLMMCEMAAFGIPVITSDIPVCHEVFDGFPNVSFIDNDDKHLSLESQLTKESKCIKDPRFYMAATVSKEVELINKICKK